MSSWNIVHQPEDKSTGGFQNRDVGKSNFSNDFGPDYGIDFARFVNGPAEYAELTRQERMIADEKVKTEVMECLMRAPEVKADHVELFVQNGFVFLKGPVENDEMKVRAEELASEIPGVLKVVNVLTVRYQ